MHYRIRIDNTYTTVNNANGALASINTVLTNAGRAEQATRSGTQVSVVIDPVADQATAETLRDALLPAWSANPRSFGKVSVVRVDP